jgi:hypothetical protein
VRAHAQAEPVVVRGPRQVPVGVDEDGQEQDEGERNQAAHDGLLGGREAGSKLSA